MYSNKNPVNLPKYFPDGVWAVRFEKIETCLSGAMMAPNHGKKIEAENLVTHPL